MIIVFVINLININLDKMKRLVRDNFLNVRVNYFTCLRWTFIGYEYKAKEHFELVNSDPSGLVNAKAKEYCEYFINLFDDSIYKYFYQMQYIYIYFFKVQENKTKV